MSPGPVCTDPTFCPGTETPPTGGGGAGRDGGVDVLAPDGGAPDAAVRSMVNVSGQVVVVLALPPLPDSLVEPNWQVDSLLGMSGDGAFTDADGNFVLNNATAVDGELTLRARPPAGRGVLGGLATHNALGSVMVRGGINVVQADALDRAAAGAGITPNATNAHAVIQLTGVATSISGVRAEVLGTSTAQLAFDDGSTAFTASAGQTGAKGMILVLNATAPDTGGFVDLRLSKGTAAVNVRIRVAAGTVAWADVPPP